MNIQDETIIVWDKQIPIRKLDFCRLEERDGKSDMLAVYGIPEDGKVPVFLFDAPDGAGAELIVFSINSELLRRNLDTLKIYVKNTHDVSFNY
ncbi:hypothetical protein [Vibrio harveyi]|uniref:hypothetical protein n=1 Tax=Vibrio harveyi TaxID=669 RepID=UPI00165E4122|nr:hypothetical protein [Vibrio harveyi]